MSARLRQWAAGIALASLALATPAAAMPPVCQAFVVAHEHQKHAHQVVRENLDSPSGRGERWQAWMDAANEERYLLDSVHETISDPMARELLDGLRDSYRIHQRLGQTFVKWIKNPAIAPNERSLEDAIFINMNIYGARLAVTVAACEAQ